MKTEFTKGPWVNEDWSYEITTKECSLPIAKVTVFNEAKANAHLIAAAPAMYELLDEIAELMNYDDQAIADGMVQNFDKIEALLKKARGEQHE